MGRQGWDVEIDPNAALSQAAQFGDLAFVLVLCILIISSLAGVIVWKVVIPNQESERANKARVADAQQAYFLASKENDGKYASAFEQQTVLIAGLTSSHESLHEKVDYCRREVDQIHTRLKSL